MNKKGKGYQSKEDDTVMNYNDRRKLQDYKL